VITLTLIEPKERKAGGSLLKSTKAYSSALRMKINFARGPLKKLDQHWGLLLVGVLLIVAVVLLVFLVFHQ
jgi:hypothetical protein